MAAVDTSQCLLSTSLTDSELSRELQFPAGSEGLGAQIYFFESNKAPIEVIYSELDIGLVWDLKI